MKREDTIAIEEVLLGSCFGSNPKLATEYGTTEVTLNVHGITKGKEIVDFLAWNPKNGAYKCYEIKVTMSDFHSDAKKSWYGDYNYLVISKELYSEQTLDEWKREVPYDVGIIVIDPNTFEKETVKKASKRDISIDTRTMLKDCLLRTLFYQNQNDNFCLRRKQQTIDAVPVVYGHWKDVWDNGISSKAVCSKCLKVSKRPVGQFCRWCGAHMKEGEGHEP